MRVTHFNDAVPLVSNDDFVHVGNEVWFYSKIGDDNHPDSWFICKMPQNDPSYA